MRTLHEIGEGEARLAVDTIAAELKRRSKAASIAVADRHGELIALLRADGASLTTMKVAANKAFTAARTGEPSGNIGDSLRADGWDISFLGDPHYIGWPGGIPVILGGEVVGAVAVSGLTGEEDVELATMAVKEILKAVG